MLLVQGQRTPRTAKLTDHFSRYIHEKPLEKLNVLLFEHDLEKHDWKKRHLQAKRDRPDANITRERCEKLFNINVISTTFPGLLQSFSCISS